MSRNFILSVLLFSLIVVGINTVYAGPGDTIVVQTFTFGSPQDAKFLFPDISHKFSKILMYYTLKCNPAQNPACGEWDYLTYNNLYEHTGKLDSTIYSHANFLVNGNTPDSLSLMNAKSWKYFPRFEFKNNTLAVSTVQVGTGIVDDTLSSFLRSPDVRFSYIWRAGELTFAGLSSGDITGIRFYFNNAGINIQNLKIRMSLTAKDSLDGNILRQSNFTEVYSSNTAFTSTGWNVIKFNKPFAWDGTSNLIIDISFPNDDATNYISLKADNLSFISGVYSGENDNYLAFNGPDYVEVPVNVFNSIDSAVTIAFWQYGDNALQPEDNSFFEGFDSNGKRVINLHLPWSDGKIYWDAGNTGGTYDRISKQSDSAAEYKGKWNHWAVIKDVKTGTMSIFLNGKLWYSVSGKTLRMKGIKKFKIGSSADAACCNYDGLTDEFSIWNKALDSTAVKNIMFDDIDASNPDYSHLVAYYRFNEGKGLTTVNEVPSGGNAKLTGIPEWRNYGGTSRFRNFRKTYVRPQIIFEKGNFNTTLTKKSVAVDSIPMPLMMVVMFRDTIHPAVATDTIYKWPGFFHSYLFNTTGHAKDSVLVKPDSMLHKVVRKYYGKPFEVVNTYELGRYITPYGIGLDLGNGFTWIYDVTDYAPLLHDSVHLSGGNWQEFLDMKFVMIEGTPPRNVKKVATIYQGSVGFNANAENTFLVPKKFYIPADVKMARVKMRVTGHGMQGTENCAEFCAKIHILKINDIKRFDHPVWRDDCSLNPLYPQGGTWIFSRSNWCPGAEVRTADFEITPFITPGDTVKIDYDFQPYSGGGSPNYVVVGQLVTYGDYNFNLDAAVDEIISPNNMKLFLRENPICGEPKIVFSNNGKTDLTSLDIAYGAVGGKTANYHWTGNLKFGQKDTLVLPSFDWGIWTGVNIFKVQISNPNGSNDEYAYNNVVYSRFDIPPVMSNKLVLYLNTNHAADETSYSIEDENGNVVKSRSTFANNTLYKDTIILHDGFGCYTFRLKDAGDDGLKFWYNMPPYGTGTAGSCRFRNLGGKYYPVFQADFGRELIYSFTTNYGLDIQLNKQTDETTSLDVFPNPAKDRIYTDIIVPGRQNVTVNIYDMYGRMVSSSVMKNFISDVVEISLVDIPAGVYYCTLYTGSKVITRKFMVAK